MYYDTPLNFLWNKSSKLGHCVFRQGFWLEKCLRTWRFSTSPELRWIFRRKKAWLSFFTTPNLEGLSWIPHLEQKIKKLPTLPSGKKIQSPHQASDCDHPSTIWSRVKPPWIPNWTVWLFRRALAPWTVIFFGGELWGPLVAVYRLKLRCLKQEA